MLFISVSQNWHEQNILMFDIKSHCVYKYCFPAWKSKIYVSWFMVHLSAVVVVCSCHSSSSQPPQDFWSHQMDGQLDSSSAPLMLLRFNSLHHLTCTLCVCVCECYFLVPAVWLQLLSLKAPAAKHLEQLLALKCHGWAGLNGDPTNDEQSHYF